MSARSGLAEAAADGQEKCLDELPHAQADSTDANHDSFLELDNSPGRLNGKRETTTGQRPCLAA